MATKTKNIYGKIMEARLMFLESNPQKSGRNEFQKFSYYELDDIVPSATRICNELQLYTEIDMGANLFGYATLTVINIENPEERTYFRIKMPEIGGGNSNQVLQDTGKTETYLRRYLYLLFLDIAQNDEVDATDNRPQRNNPTKPRNNPSTPSAKKPAPSTRKQPLTTNKKLTKKQVKELAEMDETLAGIIKDQGDDITMKNILDELNKMETNGELSSKDRLAIAKKISTIQ